MKTLFSRVLLLTLLIACADDGSLASYSTEFESGSIASVRKSAFCDFELRLAPDNSNPSLPASFRNWWFVRLEDVPTQVLCNFTLANRGWPFSYNPVFSYDGESWQRIDGSARSLGCDRGISSCLLKFSTRFAESSVYLARYYPYSLKDLNSYLSGIGVDVEVIGQTQAGRDIKLLRFGPEDSTTAVWVHARTHPAETPGSFAVEGIINSLLSGSELAYYIVPMHNVDGVVNGNYRTDLNSRNLETLWHEDSSLPEIRALQTQMRKVAAKHSYVLALNLHASNSPPEDASYGILHFAGSSNPEERKLFEDQRLFLSKLNEVATLPVNELLTRAEFLDEALPETWWWNNYGARVTALTLEFTYENAGLDRLTEPQDIRNLGTAIVEAAKSLP